MGLLDEAIREHLELKRRRGADAGEVSREESEALAPIRRSDDGAPEISPAEPPRDEHDAPRPPPPQPPRDEPLPAWAQEAAPPAPAPAAEDSAAAESHPPIAPPAFYNEPTRSQAAFEPLLPRSLTSPPASSAPPEEPRYDEPQFDEPQFDEPQFDEPLASEPVDEPEPERAKSRFGGGLSRLRPRRQRKGDPPPGDADDTPPDSASPMSQIESFHDRTAAHDAPPPAPPVFEDRPPAPPPAGHEPPDAAYEPPRPAYQPPPPPPPPPATADDGFPPPTDEPEDPLEETPEFLEETPDHDRLWFEQRPPRDFDFDK